jgi:HAMP domain-containing protein
MTSRTLAHLGALVALAFLVAMPVAPLSAASTTMDALDPDRDGTIDMAEALSAAGKVFNRLNPDNDGTLDAHELAGRLNPARDPDKDGTIDADEYMAIVIARFKRANPDNDGTIDDRELHSPAGQALLRLIK